MITQHKSWFSNALIPRKCHERRAHHRHHRLRPLSRFPSGAGARGRHRSELAHARPSRDFLAFYLQSRMGRVRIIVRQIRGTGDAKGFRHHRSAGLCLAAVSLCFVLCEPQGRHQKRQGSQGQTHRRAGMGAHRGGLYARLVDERGRCCALRHRLDSGRHQRSRPHRKGRNYRCQRAFSSPACRTKR